MEPAKVCQIYYRRRSHCLWSLCLPTALPRAERGTFQQNEPVSISQSSPSVRRRKNASNRQPVERILRDLDAQWSKAAAAKDVEQTVAYYSDDAIVLPPNATSAATKETIRNVWKDMSRCARPRHHAGNRSEVQLGSSGDMAWVSGTYELTMNDRERQAGLTIAGNTSRSGKNRLTEIGNARPTCGIPISRLRRQHLLRKNSRSPSCSFCRT